MPRWLFAVLTVLALCVRGVTAFAAAGWVGDTSCCCPSKQVCKCHHDHDGDAHPHDTLKRCAGNAEQVEPELVSATEPAAPEPTEERAIVCAPELAPAELFSILPIPPEPPPI